MPPRSSAPKVVQPVSVTEEAVSATVEDEQVTDITSKITGVQPAVVETPVVEATAETTVVVEAPVVGDVAPVEEVAPVVEAAAEDKVEETAPVVATTPEVPPVVEPTAAAPVVAKKVANHIAFFEQYLDAIKNGKPEHAIKAFNNCIKSVLALKSAEAYDEVFNVFKENKEFLGGKIVLQSAAILPKNERATLEIISMIFHIIITNPKAPANLEMARTVIKNDSFINWCAKKIQS